MSCVSSAWNVRCGSLSTNPPQLEYTRANVVDVIVVDDRVTPFTVGELSDRIEQPGNDDELPAVSPMWNRNVSTPPVVEPPERGPFNVAVTVAPLLVILSGPAKLKES